MVLICDHQFYLTLLYYKFHSDLAIVVQGKAVGPSVRKEHPELDSPGAPRAGVPLFTLPPLPAILFARQCAVNQPLI